MNDNKREEIALFRYGIVLPFLTQDELEWGMKGELQRRLAAQSHAIPHSKKHRIDEETIRKWVARYKSKGFDGLKPKSRNDAGKPRKISMEAWEKAVALRKEAPRRSVRKIIQIMEAHMMIKPGEIKESTLARHFKEHHFDRKSLGQNNQTFRRFEAERPNQLWQSDMLYGPYLPDPDQPGKTKRTFLVAFIDDFSRLVPHAEFYWDEDFPVLENTFKKAMLRRGRPETIYVDNGAVYSARRLDAACAALGVRKISCKPYSPQGKGKIERFFGTVRGDFLQEPEITQAQTLPELNRLFWAWLEMDYHKREHSAIGMPPLQRWRENIGKFLRTVGEADLVELFLAQASRTVTKVGLVSVQGIEFEVDTHFQQRKVEVRYNPFDLSFVKIYYKDNFVQKAYRAKLSRWNTAQKTKPAAPAEATGIKPLDHLAQQHKADKQQQVKKLVGAVNTARPAPANFTLPEFIRAVTTALGKMPDALHAVEITAMQTFFNEYQPLTADCVGIAMAKAVLAHGQKQHVDVYLTAIKSLQLKWKKEADKS